MNKILVVEDDQTTNEVTTAFLQEAGFQVASFFDGESALESLEKEAYALLILDVMLPKMNGIDLLKKIRETSEVPVILLTALSDEYSQTVGFLNGVDDYVTKPFSPSILVKRVEAILRRSNQTPSENKAVLKSGEIVCDNERKTVWVNKKIVFLTKKEFSIVYQLMAQKGKVVTREQLLDELWGYDEFPNDRVIYTHIKNIRKKIPAFSFKTVKGIGYLFEGEAHEA
ncbi:two-component system, OmpR family, response regulator Irr [Enterococcus sp. AZ194]|uniref:response regulator transcription factor n=1 Tax=Enterococcus sp. AZ194 TaxID=2774629 RepID=UPI003F254F04